MKSLKQTFVFLIFLIFLVQEVDARRGPFISILGISDLTFIDFIEGLATGFSRKDARGKIDTCFLGTPAIII